MEVYVLNLPCVLKLIVLGVYVRGYVCVRGPREVGLYALQWFRGAWSFKDLVVEVFSKLFRKFMLNGVKQHRCCPAKLKRSRACWLLSRRRFSRLVAVESIVFSRLSGCRVTLS